MTTSRSNISWARPCWVSQVIWACSARGALGGFDGAGLALNGACAGSGTVVPISVESNKADRAIWVGYSPWAMAIRP